MVDVTIDNDNELPGEVIDLLAAAGFVPTDPDLLDEGEVGGIVRKTVDHFTARGFTAVRFEGDDSLTFVRDSVDDGITLMSTTPSGVVHALATFDFTRRAVAWLEGAIS